jgi:hypothetical protein
MKLMANPPEKGGFMPPSVPPIVDKRRNEICEDRLKKCVAWPNIAKFDERKCLQPSIPREASQKYDAHLNGVNKNHSRPPGAYLGQFVCRPDSFNSKQSAGDNDENSKDHRLRVV